MPSSCPECGATFANPARTCRERFAELLALDHSRREPWGSRHGLVFAAYQLQHPAALAPEAIERAWLILFSIYVRQVDPARVFAALRARPWLLPGEWDLPRPVRPTPGAGYAVTIADLGDFEPSQFPAAVDRWCRAVVEAWGGPVSAHLEPMGRSPEGHS